MNPNTTTADSNGPQAAARPANAGDPDRSLALELVRATEAAAIACSRYMGFGDKEQVDQAADENFLAALRGTEEIRVGLTQHRRTISVIVGA